MTDRLSEISCGQASYQMTTMHSQGGSIEIGHISGCGIAAILFDHAALFLRFRYVVISCIDSDQNVSEMKHIVRGLLAADCEVEEIGTVLQVNVSRNALDFLVNTFTGFDEVWFFDGVPSYISQPPSITSERMLTDTTDPFVQDTVSALPNWMKLSHCTLGLGDGAGLNYVTADSSTGAFLAHVKRP